MSRAAVAAVGWLAAAAVRADPLGSTLQLSPPIVSVGQSGFAVVDLVDNEACPLTDVVPLGAPQAGCGVADGLRWDAVASGSATVSSGPSPACATSLATGQHGTFTWTFTATGPGLVTFSLTCAGQETGGGGCVNPQAEFAAAVLTVQRPPLLVATLRTDSAAVPYLSTVTVWMDITNNGDATAINVLPFQPVITGPGGLAVLPCPPLAPLCGSAAPPVTWTLSGGGTTTSYVWSYRATTAGPLTVSASFSGTDNNSGATVLSNRSVLPLTVGAPNVLSLTVTGWTALLVGQTLSLTVAAMNVSATELTQSAFTVLLDGVSGFADVTDVRFPLPRLYDAGQVREFTLTVALHADAPLGTHVFQLVAVGTDTTRGLPLVSAGGTATLPVVAGRSGFTAKPPFTPNPWRASRGGGVTVNWTVAPAQEGRVTVRLLTLTGDTVRTLADGTAAAGVYSATWDGRNAAGQWVASGVYLVHFEAPGVTDVRKLAVIR